MIWLNGVSFSKFSKIWGILADFQGSISSLAFIVELWLSLLTYRNSYFVYSKKVFSMTLNFIIKVKWHSILLGHIFANMAYKVVPELFKNVWNDEVSCAKYKTIKKYLKIFLVFAGRGSRLLKVLCVNVTTTAYNSSSFSENIATTLGQTNPH